MNLRTPVLAIIVALGSAATSRADFALDTFNNPDPARIYQIYLLNGNPYNSPIDAVGAGVSRAINVMVNAPLPPNFNSVSGQIGGGLFTMDTDNATKATSTITYTLTGAAQNFSGMTSLDLAFLNLNPGNTSTGIATSVPVEITIATSGGSLTQSTSLAGSGVPFVASFGIGSFGGSGNLAQVNSISITLNGGESSRFASDFALDEIRVSVVPTPPAVLLAGIGLVALCGRTRWLRRSPNPAA